MCNLFKKELLGDKDWIFILCGFVVGSNLLFLPLARSTAGISIFLPLSLTLLGFLLFVFVKSFIIWKEEWDQKKIFLLLSLPVPGYKIVLSKLFVLAFEIFLYLFIALLLPLLTYQLSSNVSYGIKLANFVKLWLIGSFWLFLILPFSTFAYLLGRVFSRFRGLITTAGLVGIIIIFFRYIHFGQKIFFFIPKFSIKWSEVGFFTVNTPQIAATFLFDLVLLWASSYFIEKAEL